MLHQLTQNKFARLMLTAGLCLTTVFANPINCNAAKKSEAPSLEGGQLALKIKRSDVLEGDQPALKLKRSDVLEDGQPALKLKRADV
ncbi:MAG: hypothetical protein IGS48_14395 [Oscillatoriales cyanobacterium C42_A2020_001]|nr:hypothetical protein [Leptolyngbyaceae cyanobacterium C42_A2020_001]